MSTKKYTRTKYEGVFAYETGQGKRFARKVSGVRKPNGRIGDSWKGGFHTAREAREDRNQVLQEIRHKTYVRPSKMTFGDYLNRKWLPTLAGRDTRASTIASYQVIVRRRIPAWLASTPLAEIEGDDLDRLYAELLTSGRKDGKGLAKNSVRNTHIVIHKALEDARRWKLIARNPGDDCDPPKQASPGSVEMKTWTRSQLNEFLSHVSDDRFYAPTCWQPAPVCAEGRFSGFASKTSTPPPVASRFATRS